MKVIQKLLDNLDPKGSPFFELQELFDLRNGYTPSKANAEYWGEGDIPWFRMEDIRENGRVLGHALQQVPEKAIKGGKSKLFPANSILVATSATIGEHALVTVPHISNQRFTSLAIKSSFAKRLNSKFAFYYCFLLTEWCLRNTTTSSFASVDMAGFRKFKFPVPPLEVQEKIVEILDTFSRLEAELEAELEARKKQYLFYQEQLLDFSANHTDFKRIAEIADVGTGSSNRNESSTSGAYPLFVRSKTVYQSDDFEFDEEAIVIPGEGGIGEIFHFVNGKYALHQRAYRIHVTDKSIEAKFAWYFMKSCFKKFILARAVSATVTSIRKPMILDFEIPVPPKSVQQEIVRILDQFESLEAELQAELQARRMQHGHYRDKMLTFKESAA